MASTFKGPLVTGTVRTGSASDNTGTVRLSKTVTLVANAANQVDKTIKIPVGSRIDDYVVDTVTAWNGTAAPITIGTVALGTQYSAAISGLTAGRTRPTYTGAQLLAMRASAAGTTAGSSDIVISAAPTGANTAGETTVTVFYTQLPNDNAPV